MDLLKPKVTIALLILIMVLIAGYFLMPDKKDSTRKNNEYANIDQSIAILPFDNMNDEPDQEYFNDGLAEGIHNSLAQLKGLKVSARTSSFKFRGNNINIKEAGRRLGVRTILEGRFQRRGDDIYALQDKIAFAIAEKLKLSFWEDMKQLVDKKPKPGKEAYDLYLKGRSYWNLRTLPDLKKGIDFFQRAIKLDPSFAAAYSGIADCYTALGYLSLIAPKDAFPKALEAATKALELDSTLAEPHASLGYYRFYYDWDWAAAEQEFRMAIALNPNYELAYDWYGYYLTAMKRYDEAIAIFKKAAELDPLSVPIITDIGFSFYYGGNYDEAIKKLKLSLEMNPGFGPAHLWLGRTFQQKQMFDSAIIEYKNTLKAIVDWPVALAAIGNVYGVSGNKIEAQKILGTLNALSTKKFVTSYGMALLYTGLDEKEKAFTWLNNAFEERSNWLVWLKSDPRLAPLRSDKRYTELVNKVGLPE